MLLGHHIVGSGAEKVIVFNDWMADCTSWEPMYPYLDAESFTYAFTDVRGYGRSKEIKGEYNEVEAARDSFALADHLGWDRFHVVGFSMTGLVIERMVLDKPERIKTEVAVATVPARGAQDRRKDKPLFIRSVTEDEPMLELAGRINKHHLTDQWRRHKLMLARNTRTPEAALAYLDMWMDTDFSAEVAAAKPATPLLVVACEWDQDPSRTAFMEHHVNAERVVILNCGHCPMQETPVYLATIIERFMKRHA